MAFNFIFSHQSSWFGNIYVVVISDIFVRFQVRTKSVYLFLNTFLPSMFFRNIFFWCFNFYITADAKIRWFKEVKLSSCSSLIVFTTMLIFEIAVWFLLVFLIFGRGLRSHSFWTFIHSIKTLSFSSFILASSCRDCWSMFDTSGLWPFWTLLLIFSKFT